MTRGAVPGARLAKVRALGQISCLKLLILQPVTG
jgi:hypothetical protein